MRRYIVALLLAGVFLSAANAQIEKGSKELSVNISRQSMGLGGDNDERVVVWMAAGSFGYFLSPVNELGLVLTAVAGIFTSDEADDEMGMGFAMLGVFFTRHFILANPKMLPYVGADISKGLFPGWDEDEYGDKPSMLGVGIYGGLKYYLSEKTSIGPELQLRQQSVEVDGNSDTVGANILMIKLSTIF